MAMVCSAAWYQSPRIHIPHILRGNIRSSAFRLFSTLHRMRSRPELCLTSSPGRSSSASPFPKRSFFVWSATDDCLCSCHRFAGSDVAGLQTTATKTEDGKHWIVNGTKKWITNGTFADYFTIGCKTEVHRSFAPVLCLIDIVSGWFHRYARRAWRGCRDKTD